jgi:hypothetical protein
VGLAIAALAIGVAVLLYQGPGRAVVRGHVGDVAATMLVFAVLSLVWRARIATRATATLAIATAIELGQTFWKVESSAGALLLGTTFDPWDLVAYAIGVVIAVTWETVRRAPSRRDVARERRRIDVAAADDDADALAVQASTQRP